MDSLQEIHAPPSAHTQPVAVPVRTPTAEPTETQPAEFQSYVARAQTSDRYYALFDAARGGRGEQPRLPAPAAQAFETQQAVSRVQTQRFNIDLAVQRKKNASRTLHGHNNDMGKRVRDTDTAIYDLNMASHMRATGPEYFQQSVRRLLQQSQGFANSMQSMGGLMSTLNASNSDIRREVGDVPAEVAELAGDGIAPSELAMDLEAGRYDFEWTKGSLSHGGRALQHAADAVQRSFKTVQKGEDRGSHASRDSATDGLVHGTASAETVVSLEKLEAQSGNVQDLLVAATAAEDFNA